ncbi:hypothetical protein [Actinophytocola sp.]|uniref:hypothetical protein n=1 Tax=Actinophytocola sp. TaxID=1872138 RepID=UPI002D804394|nr:hypothetical protein [Actinophytocola sp.]HET9140449.1 hypothetical protein [Actinophytocola sp.]
MLAQILALLLSALTGINPPAPSATAATVLEPAAATQVPTVNAAPRVTSPAPVQEQPAAAPKPAAQSFAERLNAAVAAVPGAGSATWVVADKGSWGATDLSRGVVYIAPRTPANRLLDVVRHEWVHVAQGRIYGGIGAAKTALAHVGGIEVVADCGAKLQGARWTHYTKTCTPAQTAAARQILSGQAA